VKLEEAIKQSKPFESVKSKALINIHYTASWLSNKNSELLAPYQITIQQYNVLRILRGQYPNPATIKLLIDRMIDKSSNASRLVDKLYKKEFVNRIQCPMDRRQVDVIITDKGLRLLKDLDKKMKAKSLEILGLNDAEAEQLSNLLDKLRD
jgi:DNA-binding MarR family transcriptional regulator